MLEALGCIVLALLGMFILFVGMALEQKLKAQANLFRVEARRANNEDRILQRDIARSLAAKNIIGSALREPRGGLPESMLPRAFESTFPKV